MTAALGNRSLVGFGLHGGLVAVVYNMDGCSELQRFACCLGINPSAPPSASRTSCLESRMIATLTPGAIVFPHRSDSLRHLPRKEQNVFYCQILSFEHIFMPVSLCGVLESGRHNPKRARAPSGTIMRQAVLQTSKQISHPLLVI